MRTERTLIVPAVSLAVLLLTAASGSSGELVLEDSFELLYDTPASYSPALRNPMKGFIGNIGHEWATLSHRYIRWNELEDDLSHGMDRILVVTDQKFANGPQNNVKFIPRVYLHWSADDQKYWPADMTTDDYTSEQFQFRATRLVERLGQAWNDDPRVAFVELGIFGKWGEHHSPSPTLELQQLVGQAFRDAFPDKQVSVRHAWSEFEGFGFGEYWDSWGHYQQMWPHGNRIAELNENDDFYLSSYVGGEVAYNWGAWEIQPGTTPTDSVSDPVHRDFIINSIRWLHNSHLRWISAYDAGDPVARAGAEELQRSMGYRFVLDRVGFTQTPDWAGLRVELDVRNEGSAPFYYDWPIEVALLDGDTREVVWRDFMAGADIRRWTPARGWTPPEWEAIDFWPFSAVVDGWSSQAIGWAEPAQVHTVAGLFWPNVPAGEYVVTVAIVDPAGMQPSLRFATAQYWNGGRHPIGKVGIGQPGTERLPSDFPFDSPALDDSLDYAWSR